MRLSQEAFRFIECWSAESPKYNVKHAVKIAEEHKINTFHLEGNKCYKQQGLQWA